MADGTITFSTALDNSQLEKELKRTEKEVEALKRKVEEGNGEESFLKGQMDEARRATEEAEGAVRSLREELGVVDDGELAASMREANREVASLRAKLDEANAGKSAIEEQMDAGEAAIHRTEHSVMRLTELLHELEEVDPSDADAWFGAQQEIDGVRRALAEANAELGQQIADEDALNDRWQALDAQASEYAARLDDASARQGELAEKGSRLAEASAALKEQAKEQDRLTKKWQATNGQVEKYTRQLERATGRQRELGEEYARTYSRAGTAVSAGMERARSSMDAFSSRVNTMLKRVFVFGVILRAVRAIASALTGALQENQRFSASWENLKATVTGVANAIANMIAPALTGMVNAATAAIQTLAQTVDSLFGTNIMRAIQAARSAAEANWRQTDASKEAQKALDKQKKATKDLAKEQKKATRTLLSFDEINAMQAEHAEDAADALGDEADGLVDPSSLLKPDWDAFDVGKIDAKLAEIMLMLGAALMAVGAILCFSGINIPLGITLMMVGALLVYTAYKEQWDKLPDKVRDAVTGALAITGTVLVVLGAVLAFSGVNVPLGIGMMVAGALLLWTAVGLNWDSMSDEMRNVVTVLMGVLSGALLVMGAILAFTGASVPLGIALMVAGAVSLASVAAINWNRMSEEVQNAVTLVMGVLGGALLVVGAILALAGVSLPLGIGLMAAGAVVLGANAALNWDAIRENLDVVVPLIEATVGGALLVVGAALAFSGVNVPLGLGLMSVGAVGLGKAVLENWDRLPDEVKGVIATIELAVGGAALVVGAVLCLSGINIPLGLGLLASGAVAMGHALTDNWGVMPQRVQSVVALVEAAVAPALLVVGAILTLTAVNLPLGLGLLAVGALTLAHLASIDWDAMPDHVRETVTEILTEVGSALLVIGVILCVSGVGIPLGIACILAGIGSFVGAAALNWDFVLDKVREVWGDVASFFHSNIEPVFSWEWWARLFKGIVNGLISMLNEGLGAFGSFVNELAGGISGILDNLGVTGWSFSIGMPQIPYLAQGAVIPPNREFMAVLGDQSHGNNIETPEALMRQVVREEAGSLVADAIREIMAASSGSDRDVVLVVSPTELARATVRGMGGLRDSGELGNLGIAFG